MNTLRMSPKRSRTKVPAKASSMSPGAIMEPRLSMPANTSVTMASAWVSPRRSSDMNRSASRTTQVMPSTKISGSASCSSLIVMVQICHCCSVESGVRPDCCHRGFQGPSPSRQFGLDNLFNQVFQGWLHHVGQRQRVEPDADDQHGQHGHHDPFAGVKVLKGGHVVVGHLAIKHALDQPQAVGGTQKQHAGYAQ